MKRGLLMAYDAETGVLTDAADSVIGRKYRCPYCNVSMHRSTTRKKKNRIFVLSKHMVHTDEVCKRMENEKKERTFAGISPKKLIDSFCHVTSRSANSKDKERGERKPVDHDTGYKPLEIDEEDEKEQATFSSLKQIAEAEIYRFKPYSKFGDYYLSDYLITFVFADQIVSPGYDLGARIVHTRFTKALFKDEKALISQMFFKGKIIVFGLFFGKRNTDFKGYIDKLYTQVEDPKTGKTIFKKWDMLIASDNWELIPKPNCANYCTSAKCENCLGFNRARFSNCKQIYIFEAPHKEHE